ncbi:MAG: glycosyltransferase, partial [Sphingobacteriia bacterium]
MPENILQSVFWLLVGLILYTYLFFPALLYFARRGQKIASPPGGEQQLPPLSILLAVHNEAAIMEERLNNLLKTQYPAEVEILIGTDACTDATDALIAERALQDARLRHFRFPERQGKPNIIT